MPASARPPPPAKREIAVLMDLTGPSIRTGDVEQPWQLQVGDTVEFRCKPEIRRRHHASTPSA
jgi:pyruvate kinase